MNAIINDLLMEKKIYLAGGCFWGTDHLFSLV